MRVHSIDRWRLSVGGATFALAIILAAVSSSAAAAPGKLDLGLTYKQDVLRIFSGGKDSGDAAPGMVQFNGLFKNHNDKLKVALLGTFGGAISKRLGALQGPSDIEAHNTFRLYELYYDHTFGKSGLSTRLGLQDYSALFNTIKPAQLFLNTSFGVAPTISQAYLSIYPVTTLGAVLHWKAPQSPLYVLAGIYDGEPGLPGHPGGTHVELANGDGAFTDFEIGITGKHYKLGIGGWSSTRRYTGLAGRPRNSNHGVYLMGAAQVYGGQSKPTLHVFLQLGDAEGDRNKMSQYIGAGVKLTHFVPGRPKDALALGMARVLPSDLFARVKPGAAAAETVYELTYQAKITQRLSLQPDVQYIDDPGALNNIPNAWVAGFRVKYKL
ncbi:MAG TPA: carbohydrate porin [Gammaproteobacteria bacterium]|nr:carbohydrate porin [Gammaproteobacteria bacterium]